MDTAQFRRWVAGHYSRTEERILQAMDVAMADLRAASDADVARLARDNCADTLSSMYAIPPLELPSDPSGPAYASTLAQREAREAQLSFTEGRLEFATSPSDKAVAHRYREDIHRTFNHPEMTPQQKFAVACRVITSLRLDLEARGGR